MQYVPRSPDEGGDSTGTIEVSPDMYEGQNDSQMPGDWQLSNPEEHLDSGDQAAASTGPSESDSVEQPSELETSAQTRVPTFRSVSRGGGRATVRSNVDLTFNTGNILVGRYSGTIRAGSTFTGRDGNGNGIPDILESGLKSGDLAR